MDDPVAIKEKATEAHLAQYKCECETVELRRRVVDNGGVQYVEQCLRCGSATSNPIAKTKALALNGGNEPPQFDDDLLSNWERGYSDGWAKISREYKENVERYEKARKNRTTEWWESYKVYLNSPEWKAKREKVFLRAQEICEGCRDEKAVHVHHTSYEHVGNEFLFELVAVCTKCHDRIHASDESAPNES